MAIPRPTLIERTAHNFSARAWSLRHGLCPYHGGEHEFGRSTTCRLCHEDRADLEAESSNGLLYEKKQA